MYDFRTLSPLDFEDFVRDLLQAALGVRMESFGSGRDLGIDFRFSNATGHTIVQAKHYIESGSDALVRALKLENEKARKLAPARYILATSCSLTPQLKKRIRDAMPNTPLTEADIFGREDLNNLLGQHGSIERKHFKLWLASTTVLERILHSGVYNRTQAEMDVIKAVVPKFVQNESVKRSEEILEKHRTLIISGEPGVGKSTLARMLVWLHAEQNWKISVIDDIKEAFEIVSVDEKNMIFFDDFLGQVRLSPDLVRGVDQRLPPFLQKVRASKNIRFVLTTRDYIFHQAQNQSARLSDSSVNATQFVLNVGSYTRDVKAKILFNHLYFSELSLDERSALLADDFFLKIIDHRNFNPRLIDLLTSPDYLSIGGRPIREAVESVLDNPQALWDVPYRTHISDEGRILMLALFFNSQRVSVPSLEDSFYRTAEVMGLSISRIEAPMKFRSALRELEGSVLAIQNGGVQFSNPGVRDFLQRVVFEDRLIPVAISMARELGEMRQIWMLFSGQVPKPNNGDPNVSDWCDAAKRLVECESGPAFSRLQLLIEMYDLLVTEGLRAPIESAIDQLGETELDDTDIQLCRYMLEQVTLTLLPHDLHDAAKRAISAAVGNVLANYGSVLSLEDIEMTSVALTNYGVDEDGSFSAPSAAIESQINSLVDILSELGSLDELDAYDDELSSLMRKYEVFDPMVESRIEERRVELLEREMERDGYDSESNWRPTPIERVSDDSIRSLFANLRK